MQKKRRYGLRRIYRWKSYRQILWKHKLYFVLFSISFITVSLLFTFMISCDNKADLPENATLVEVAESQIGNKGGKPYWSWYGFDEPVDWCACFVSWCADKCGYIKADKFPKFSYCQDGVDWFISKKAWHRQDLSPKAGMIVFFDRNNNGEADHVGIVKACKGGMIYTIEGNSANKCRERTYPVDSEEIYGYGEID